MVASALAAGIVTPTTLTLILVGVVVVVATMAVIVEVSRLEVDCGEARLEGCRATTDALLS